MENTNDFSLVLSNDINEKIIIGYDKKNSQYFIDRTQSGKIDFKDGFSAIHTAPRFTRNSKMDLTLIIDVSSVELFADDGLTVMTEIFFPDKIYNKLHIQSPNGIVIEKLEYSRFKSIWQ